MPCPVTAVAARLVVHGSAAWSGLHSHTVLDAAWSGRVADPAPGAAAVSTPASDHAGQAALP